MQGRAETEGEQTLRAILPAARAVASAGGRRHPLWLAILDAEAVLAGTRTTLRFASRREGCARLVDLMRSYTE